MSNNERAIVRINDDKLGYEIFLFPIGESSAKVDDLKTLLDMWQQFFQNRDLLENSTLEKKERDINHPLRSMHCLEKEPCVTLNAQDGISVDVVSGKNGCFLYLQQKVVKQLTLVISRQCNDVANVISKVMKKEKIENPVLYLLVDSVPDAKSEPKMIYGIVCSQIKEEESLQGLYEKMFSLLSSKNFCSTNLGDDLNIFLDGIQQKITS